MLTSENNQTASPAQTGRPRTSNRRAATIWTALILFLLLQVLWGWLFYSQRKLISDLDWTEAIHDRDADSEITTDAGTIQFLKRGGYSIDLDVVKYTGDGLYLSGTVGNPTNLVISNLSLDFSATKPLYQYRDEYTKDPFLFFLMNPIGDAQTQPIYTLRPGGTAPFDVTIPNVKQTKDGIRLVVAFKGERYNY